MNEPSIRPFEASDTESVVMLWRVCGLVVPQNDPHRDIARKVENSPELFFVAEVDGQIVGTCMAGYEGHRGWINYLAVHPEHRGHGWATRMMAEAESALRRLGCPKINLQVRRSNMAILSFYDGLGFVEDEVVSMGKRLITDADLE